MACGVPIEDDEFKAGRSCDWTEGAIAPCPIGEVAPDGCMKPFCTGAGGMGLPPPPQDEPTLAGGRNCMATCVFCAPREGGMGWFRLAGADWVAEPVTVGSPKVRLPRLEQPASPTAATTTPAMATALLWVRGETRILIGLLVRRNSTTEPDATPVR